MLKGWVVPRGRVQRPCKGRDYRMLAHREDPCNKAIQVGHKLEKPWWLRSRRCVLSVVWTEKRRTSARGCVKVQCVQGAFI